MSEEKIEQETEQKTAEETEQKKKKKLGFWASIMLNPKTITTLPEANLRARNLYIFIEILLLLFSAFFIFIFPFALIIYIPLCVGGVFYLYFQEKQKVKRNFCPKCGKRVDYENDVEWAVIETDEKSYNPSSGNSSSRKMTEKEISTVEFTCTCAECGEETTFTKKFVTAITYDDGTVKEHNVTTLAKKYFQL